MLYDFCGPDIVVRLALKTAVQGHPIEDKIQLLFGVTLKCRTSETKALISGWDPTNAVPHRYNENPKP